MPDYKSIHDSNLGAKVVEKALAPDSRDLKTDKDDTARLKELGNGDLEAGAKRLLQKFANTRLIDMPQGREARGFQNPDTLSLQEEQMLGRFALQADNLNVKDDIPILHDITKPGQPVSVEIGIGATLIGPAVDTYNAEGLYRGQTRLGGGGMEGKVTIERLGNGIVKMSGDHLGAGYKSNVAYLSEADAVRILSPMPGAQPLIDAVNGGGPIAKGGVVADDPGTRMTPVQAAAQQGAVVFTEEGQSIKRGIEDFRTVLAKAIDGLDNTKQLGVDPFRNLTKNEKSALAEVNKVFPVLPGDDLQFSKTTGPENAALVQSGREFLQTYGKVQRNPALQEQFIKSLPQSMRNALHQLDVANPPERAPLNKPLIDVDPHAAAQGVSKGLGGAGYDLSRGEEGRMAAAADQNEISRAATGYNLADKERRLSEEASSGINIPGASIPRGEEDGTLKGQSLAGKIKSRTNGDISVYGVQGGKDAASMASSAAPDATIHIKLEDVVRQLPASEQAVPAVKPK